MGLVDRPVEDEPEEKPDQLGRHLLRIKREHPGEWRAVYETPNRATATRIEGCLIGRGEGRIAGVTDIDHWEARLVQRTEKDATVYEIRARYSVEPHGKDWRVKPRVPKKSDAEILDGVADTATRGQLDKLRKGETPRDPDESAQAGLDLAAG